MTEKQWHERRAALAQERNEIREKLDNANGNLSLPNRIRDADIESLQTQLRWVEKDIDDLYEEGWKA